MRELTVEEMQMIEKDWNPFHRVTLNGEHTKPRWISTDGSLPYFSIEEVNTNEPVPHMQIDTVYMEPMMRFYGKPFPIDQYDQEMKKLRRLGEKYTQPVL